MTKHGKLTCDVPAVTNGHNNPTGQLINASLCIDDVNNIDDDDDDVFCGSIHKQSR